MNLKTLEIYNKMTPLTKQAIKEAINELLQKGSVNQDAYSVEKKRVVTNQHYRIINNNFNFIEGHLEISGYELLSNPTLGFFAIRKDPVLEDKKIKMNKITTVFYLLIRVMFSEKLLKMSENEVQRFSFMELKEKLVEKALFDKKLAINETKNALKFLQERNFIKKTTGVIGEEGSEYLIFPSITSLINETDAKSRIYEIEESTNGENEGEMNNE